MSENETLELDMTRVEKRVVLKNFEDGKDKVIILRELIGTDRDAYLQGLFSRMKPNGSGKSELRDVNGLQAALLTRCVVDADTNKMVEVGELQKWPARVTSALFKMAKDLSGLDDEAEEKAKND